MSTTTLTLDAFLLARIAEDEAAAMAGCVVVRRVSMPFGAWTLDRVREECKVKRRIVEWCGPIKHRADAAVLRYLATVYTDHPDYDESWLL